MPASDDVFRNRSVLRLRQVTAAGYGLGVTIYGITVLAGVVHAASSGARYGGGLALIAMGVAALATAAFIMKSCVRLEGSSLVIQNAFRAKTIDATTIQSVILVDAAGYATPFVKGPAGLTRLRSLQGIRRLTARKRANELSKVRAQAVDLAAGLGVPFVDNSSEGNQRTRFWVRGSKTST